MTVLGPFTSALFVAIIALAVQFYLFAGGRRQKAGENIVQIVTQQARDYYSAMSGAIRELALSLNAITQAAPGAHQDHFAHRAFFFFGHLLYTESSFAFSSGAIYLPHLWAEVLVRRFVREVRNMLALPLQHEAIVHKCFSDIARTRQAYDPDDQTIRFRIRTFHDLDDLLKKPWHLRTAAEHDLVDAFNAVAPQLLNPAVAQRVEAIERTLTGLLNYEFTKIFAYWYRGGNTSRALPQLPPEDYEAISGSVADWNTVLSVLSQNPPGGWLEKVGLRRAGVLNMSVLCAVH